MQSDDTSIGGVVLESAAVAFQSNKGWADKAIAQLTDEHLHITLDPETNCIAVIMKHIN